MDAKELTEKLLTDLSSAFKRMGRLQSQRFRGPTKRRRSGQRRGVTKPAYDFDKAKKRRKMAKESRRINRGTK